VASPRAIYEEHCARGELAYQLGPDGEALFPPRFGPQEWRVSAGEGAVYATTMVRRRGEEPHNISLINLDEGFRMMSRVDAAQVQIGMRVRVQFGDDAVPGFVEAK